MAPRNTPSASEAAMAAADDEEHPAHPDPGASATDPDLDGTELSFGGDLGKLLTQAHRPQRWFISNPGPDATIPEGAYIKRGYPVDMAGLIVAIERIPTRNGTMPVYVLDVGRGAEFPLVRFGLTSTTLRSAHARYEVKVGDTVAMTCPGLRTGKGVNEETGELLQYEDWRMLVQHGDGTIPAAGVGPSGDEEPY
jgi:hypothetical protein